VFVKWLGRLWYCVAEAECGDTTSFRGTFGAAVNEMCACSVAALSETRSVRFGLLANLEICCVLLLEDRSTLLSFAGMRLGANCLSPIVARSWCIGGGLCWALIGADMVARCLRRRSNTRSSRRIGLAYGLLPWT
jgi:hypothetical protein